MTNQIKVHFDECHEEAETMANFMDESEDLHGGNWIFSANQQSEPQIPWCFDRLFTWDILAISHVQKIIIR